MRPWHLGNGAIGGIFIFSDDITRYKQSEDEVRCLNASLERRVAERTAELVAEVAARLKSEQALMQCAAIIDSSDDAIIGKDLQGTITSWNSGAQRIFGYSEKEAVGSPLLMLIPADRQAEERECLKILDRILEIVRIPVIVDGNEVGVTASIGVTFHGSSDKDGDTLLREADRAMYIAKRDGA